MTVSATSVDALKSCTRTIEFWMGHVWKLDYIIIYNRLFKKINSDSDYIV